MSVAEDEPVAPPGHWGSGLARPAVRAPSCGGKTRSLGPLRVPPFDAAVSLLESTEMKLNQLLDRHGITENPFSQEDAQSDPVFRDHCVAAVRHPAWDKIFGRPDVPSTSVVFGEKGAGKTALKLQILNAFKQSEVQHPDWKTWVVSYDDFNPFLDAFRERLSGSRRKADKALQYWRLWDHMDAILSLATTKLVDGIVGEKRDAGLVPDAALDKLSAMERRDILLLTAFYDRSLDMPRLERWTKLKRRLKYANLKRLWDLAAGVGLSLLIVVLLSWLSGWRSLFQWWVPLLLMAVWLPWGWNRLQVFWKAWRVSAQVRVIEHAPSRLYSVLSRFNRPELAGQPAPSRQRSDDRYELLMKLQGVLKSLGYPHMVVIVDRVDEPHLIDGVAERMRDLLWPLFDNKLLKHADIGFKLLLPAEVFPLLQRQEKQFYERSRLDKQNLVPSLSWTGEALYDVANLRLQACAKLASAKPKLTDLFESTVTREDLIRMFQDLRVPRILFKFLYRLMVDHCSKYTEDQPEFTITRETLQSTLAVFKRDLADFDRGVGVI